MAFTDAKIYLKITIAEMMVNTYKGATQTATDSVKSCTLVLSAHLCAKAMVQLHHVTEDEKFIDVDPEKTLEFWLGTVKTGSVSIVPMRGVTRN